MKQQRKKEEKNERNEAMKEGIRMKEGGRENKNEDARSPRAKKLCNHD